MRPLRLILSGALLALSLLPAAGQPSDLGRAVARANHLLVLNRLQVTPEQLDRLAAAAEELTAALTAADTERTSLLEKAQLDLLGARQMLLSGRALTKQQESRLADLDQALQAAEDRRYEAAVAGLAKVRQVLFPQQNALIDWTPPRATAAGRQGPVEQARRDRDRRAMVALAEQFLTRARFISVITLGTVNLVNDFLEPLIEPNSPQYREAQQFMLKMVEQARLLPEPVWEAQKHSLAAEVVMTLGLVRTPTEGAEEQRPYGWDDLYEVFADPDTAALLREVKAAR